MRRFLIGIAVVIVLLAAVVLFRTLSLNPPAPAAEAPPTPVPAVNAMDVAQHLAQAVRFRTVSFGAHAHEAEKNAELDKLRAWMETTYPNFHRVATREIMGKSLLFTWKGANPLLAPVLLMAHMDVVPVVPGTDRLWTHDPFSGDIADGFVWGRGSIDDKGSLISILDAAERLAAAGFTPARTIMFAFGQDEEVGGATGNGEMAKTLAKRGMHYAFVLDEGGTIQTEPYPGVHRPVAYVAVAEKGYLTLRLVAHGTGGHSSTPTTDLAIAHLSKAVLATLDHPFASGLDEVQSRKLSTLAPYTPFGTRLLLGNLWLMKPIVVAELNQKQDGAARMHTTISPTIIEGGVKDNVIPPEATATINFRLNPRDTVASVIQHVRDAIDDPRVDVVEDHETIEEASKVADMDGPTFKLLTHEIHATFGDIPVAPDSTTGATDSRHYLPIADNVYRLDPFHFGPTDLTRVHGNNERLAVSDLGLGVTFFMRLMKDIR
jgi:carboxypeptidase PM20D1